VARVRRTTAAIVALPVLVLVAQLLAAAPIGQAAYPAPSAPSATAVAAARIHVYVPLSERSGGAATSAPSATPVPIADTPIPTATSTAPATNTAAAAATNSPTQRPTDTATSVPTATQTPRPTSTPVPSATPIPPTMTPALGWQRSDVVLVFLSGLRTSSSSATFATLKATLATRGWSSSQFLDYSYRPGPSYLCSDTYQDVPLSYAYLAAQLATYRQARPSARFVLVGHSLGGLVGWSELSTINAQGLAADPYGVIGLVTIDAPLLGTGSGKSTLLDAFVYCYFRSAAGLYPATIFMDTLNTYKDYYRGVRNAEAAKATSLGMRVLTVGSADDCVYKPSICWIPGVYSDDRETQYIYGYESRVSAGGWVAFNPSPSHGAIVETYTTYLSGQIEWAAAPR
jgi:pimeloyl-ACP methyl ester carboxylesterase